ncbi:hypothetical protein BABINDRAFT_169116 [Babjeviella inositovora NRRL Y-12698]|uniref:Uncharacterized protein n=1 Tax=Babjeviella inositovora NRRL Y-12698 TaxID=984486 RepID=A0A1E3QJ87_9ASCO|nr:uncharacterized protein BABINDRAFT_169116 [Babjeviella inositovora NRRL Y-12698]ODQ77514.1 hypothetical protein BABINDRAFT_169116 [Babjeviella inositovora NRRL Y-12698]
MPDSTVEELWDLPKDYAPPTEMVHENAREMAAIKGVSWDHRIEYIKVYAELAIFVDELNCYIYTNPFLRDDHLLRTGYRSWAANPELYRRQGLGVKDCISQQDSLFRLQATQTHPEFLDKLKGNFDTLISQSIHSGLEVLWTLLRDLQDRFLMDHRADVYAQYIEIKGVHEVVKEVVKCILAIRIATVATRSGAKTYRGRSLDVTFHENTESLKKSLRLLRMLVDTDVYYCSDYFVPDSNVYQITHVVAKTYSLVPEATALMLILHEGIIEPVWPLVLFFIPKIRYFRVKLWTDGQAPPDYEKILTHRAVLGRVWDIYDAKRKYERVRKFPVDEITAVNNTWEFFMCLHDFLKHLAEFIEVFALDYREKLLLMTDTESADYRWTDDVSVEAFDYAVAFGYKWMLSYCQEVSETCIAVQGNCLLTELVISPSKYLTASFNDQQKELVMPKFFPQVLLEKYPRVLPGLKRSRGQLRESFGDTEKFLGMLQPLVSGMAVVNKVQLVRPL